MSPVELTVIIFLGAVIAGMLLLLWAMFKE
jgi:hypothetical protein